MVAKNIIFCADGTWNGPPEETAAAGLDRSDNQVDGANDIATNVVKLFANLEGNVTEETRSLVNEQEKLLRDDNGQPNKIEKYIHGVGDSSDKLKRFLGGAFGMGVIARIVRGYTFISRNYTAGDKIYVVGFSRGAYTARALAGMVAKVGLLNPQTYDPSDKETAYGLGISAWKRFREQSLGQASLLTRLANVMVDVVHGIGERPLPPNGLISEVPIKAVAVWDTVGSMGIPLYARNDRVDVFRFADDRLGDKVEYGFHAMAINEMRRDFPVTKWQEREKIEQVWMIGAHADVGGGYSGEESCLSNIGLSWMMNKLASVGVRFTKSLRHSLKQEQITDAVNFRFHTPWEESPFKGLGVNSRQIAKTDVFHETVLKRLEGNNDYALPGLQTLTALELRGLKLDSALYVD
jgi:uncharacterized protein (DUF2235 family)